MPTQFKLPLSTGTDGKTTSTHVSVNPYLLTILTADEPLTGYTYDGHEAVVVDTTIATQLGNSNVGGVNTPIYLDGGIPKACTIDLSKYILRTGDTMTGPLTVNEFHGTANVDYGETLPLSATEGQIFFQISDPWYEIPAGGSLGQVLAKRSNTDRDIFWKTLVTIPDGGSAGQALIKNSASNGDVTWGAVGGIMRPNTSIKYYVTGSTSTTENTDPAIFNTAIYVQNSVLYGAAWNDYAEYRNTVKDIQPGRCVVENGKDFLILSTRRMQEGAEIISDTFGFAIGQTEKCKTPIAVTGRVLAFPFENIDEFKPGRPVCSGPNGTVSLMTDEEARQYPWCIIGTVSAIPQEKTWGSNNVSTIGRIWIRVR